MNEDGHNEGKRKLLEELQWRVALKVLTLGDVSVEELKRRLTERNKNLTASSCFVNPDFIDSWVKQFGSPGNDEDQLL